MTAHTDSPASQLLHQLDEFVTDRVIPAEDLYHRQVVETGDHHATPPIMEALKQEARTLGLWNLFLRDHEAGAGLTNAEYAPLAEVMGRSPLTAQATNCNAPDTGNMELLATYGTSEQQERWLTPLLDGSIRSCFAMTEPDAAGSDPTNIRATIRSEDDSYILHGRKWWVTGAASPDCEICIFIGISDPDEEPHDRYSLVLIPLDTPGLIVRRSLSIFGYDEGLGHAEMEFKDVKVPTSNLLGNRGDGFRLAQARLGPGRVHHAMRAIGLAERALQLMCQRAQSRSAFGHLLADHGSVRDLIAESRIEIEQARALVLHCARMMDEHGARAARNEISMIKVACARVATDVVDRAIEVHGAAGLSADFPLAWMYAEARTLHFVDGPDAVHRMIIARRELRSSGSPG